MTQCCRRTVPHAMFAAVMAKHAETKVRRARRSDAAAIARMARELSAHEGKPAPQLTAALVQRDGFGRKAAFSCLLAVCARRAVGYALYFPSYDGESALRGSHLEDLFVSPEARGRGVGRVLVAAVCGATRKAGGGFVTWHMERDNHLADSFYRGLGERCDSLVTWDLSGSSFDRLADG